VSTAYDQTGRTRQKARTRAALIAATRALLARGTTPTVEQAADRAEVSRSTAYRYFPSQRRLLVAAYPEIEADSLLGDDPPADPLERLEVVIGRLGDQLVRYEPELRAQLRVSLDAPGGDGELLPLRQGRAVGWLREALAPLAPRLGEDRLHRLALAVRATLGIEALVWLTDVGGVSRQEAVEIMRDSARALARAALG
jgi:AcrR family transcriptional regulator